MEHIKACCSPHPLRGNGLAIGVGNSHLVAENFWDFVDTLPLLRPKTIAQLSVQNSLGIDFETHVNYYILKLIILLIYHRLNISNIYILINTIVFIIIKGDKH